ncbi:MAG: hypothetical protein GY884_28925 [Proteobacteria bacterium]|nr:hypothetical protein [Pseudomonadota bacterium]
MSQRVERLFGGAHRGTRAIRRAEILLAVAIPLDVLGLITCTSVPGALMTLGAYQMAERQMKRIEVGELSVEHAPRVVRIKKVAFWAMVGCVAGFAIQLFLLSSGAYERWLGAL